MSGRPTELDPAASAPTVRCDAAARPVTYHDLPGPRTARRTDESRHEDPRLRPDYARLTTPRGHGATLVEPPPRALAVAVSMNRDALAAAHGVRILGVPLPEVRHRVRSELGLGDGPLIVTGHQPDFIHPGVWAKHVVAARMADALDGTALNVVVDSDAPRSTALPVPAVGVDGAVRLDRIPYAGTPVGYTFDQIPALSLGEVDAFANRVRSALGERFPASSMPAFFSALRRHAAAPRWVDQTVSARRAIERNLGVSVLDVCVTCLPMSDVLADWITHAERFRACYNGALDRYRAAHRVRSPQRPIPDLVAVDGRIELPLWLCHRDRRRARAFVRMGRSPAVLFADDVEVGPVAAPNRSGDAIDASSWTVDGEWQLRPRALALTLWMRLCLADLFIHGIGGAKYDRITDDIIRAYYRVEPPGFGCVSATLWMDLPRYGVSERDSAAAKALLRDVRCNPQRHCDAAADVADLIQARRDAVRQSEALRRERPGDRPARKDAFRRIHELNQALIARMPHLVERAERQVQTTAAQVFQDAIARGREYFFGLYDQGALRTLLHALPATDEFRV
ncbi:MAG: hypothetical protein C4547_11490 [Phycisphaerales bacterium]|nr:MAG: hypothetical protein C4547_11490 [Phycisphaerales bacterium]